MGYRRLAEARLRRQLQRQGSTEKELSQGVCEAWKVNMN